MKLHRVAEMVSVIKPIEVKILDTPVQISNSTASLQLARQYSIYLSKQWDANLAQLLLQTLESIPHYKWEEYKKSFWSLTDLHIHNDIRFSDLGEDRFVVMSLQAFNYSEQRLAEIDGIRGRFFSKRLHRALVRYVTDNGSDRYSVERILNERYAVSVSVSDYEDLTRYTTGEHAGRFTQFKDDELIEIVSMLEEYPTGMLKTPGLKYIVRRLDGLPHPIYPAAAAVAWPSAGYIEFMESAFKAAGL